jgi:hypothetical protein
MDKVGNKQEQENAMKSDRIKVRVRLRAATQRERGIHRCFTVAALMFVALSQAAAQQQLEAVRTAPEPAPQQPPLNNWFNASTPGVRALARPGSFIEFDRFPEPVCCPGKKNTSLCHRLLEWCTYCPKYRVCSCSECCNSCQYKGVVHPYLFLLNPKCYEGSGLRQTFCNECYRGSKDCGCTDGASVGPPRAVGDANGAAAGPSQNAGGAGGATAGHP